MKRFTLFQILVFAAFGVCSCSHAAEQQGSACDPQAVADSTRAAEVAKYRAESEPWPPEVYVRLLREDSLIRVGYERVGGEKEYNRWLSMQEMLFNEFLENCTLENKRKLMDFMAEHNMFLVVPKPITKEWLAGDIPPEDRGIHPRLILWESDDVSDYLDRIIRNRERIEREQEQSQAAR